jgi:hypothetical protein
MPATTLFDSPLVSVVDYRCTATPTDQPFTESHGRYSLAYVRKGSFGCHARGKSFQLIAGSFMVGYPGDEYVCTHDHHDHADECLSFQLSRSWWTRSAGQARRGARARCLRSRN